MIRLTLALAFLGSQLASAQSFIGTNAPGGATNYSLTIPITATNVSLVISNNATAYSHLLLKRNGTPTDTDFDFISRLNGRTNQINLELPEFQTGNYGLRVRTSSGSLTHTFNVAMTTDRQDLRSGGYPVLKPHVFTTTGTLPTNVLSGTWHYFQVDVPTNLPGWRIVLSTNSGSASNPDLFIRAGQIPTQFSYDKASQNQALDTITFTDTEATNFTYFIGVFLPPPAVGSANYTLSTEIGYLKQLTWDPGTAHSGTQAYTNTSAIGGDYFFRITTQSPSVGAWRTALYVDSGEADVAIRQNTFSDLYSQYTFRQSARVGSDGWVLHSSEFGPAQNWYIVVRASPGAQWRLLSGDVYVQNLGTLATDASSSSGPVPMGPEGMRFFRTTTTVNTLAWRLWLNGANNQILVRDTSVPHPRSTSYYDWQATGQMLLVPNYLVGGQSYFVGVIGNPSQTINLDSRQHGFTDIPFNSTTPVSVTGYGYTTYRVQVPVQQIAWLTTVTPSAGDANVAIRRDFIPNEFYNNGFSDVGGSVADSVSLVPPTLSDGTYYVTVWGNTPFTCSLFTGNPVITDVAYVSTTQNNDPGRVGWRYFRVPDISSQLGTLGWDLILSNYVANSELAIRQNAVPSRWNFRNGSSNNTSSAHIDYTGGTSGFLQRPGHQADIWYVGVYNPGAALGPFWLILQQLQATGTTFDGGSMTRNAVAAGRWEYFRVDVPANCLGWDVRLVNVLENGALPLLVLRCDQLPDALTTGPWSFPQLTDNWPSGYRWGAGSDWTGRQFNPAGSVNESGRILAMGKGRPLEPGTYYVGVNNQNANLMTYSVQSRGIGNGLSIPVIPLGFAGGSATNTLAAREAAYYSIEVPPNTPNWKLKMRAAAGESLLIVLKDIVPSVAAGGGAGVGFSDSGRKMQKVGDEQWLLLPQNNSNNLVAGTYYLAVASEGLGTTNNNRIGTGSSTYELTSLGSLATTDMGALTGPDLIQVGALEGGEVAAYKFTVPVGTLAMEVWLENKTGDPGMAIVPSTELPYPNSLTYGGEGGRSTGRLESDTLINVAHPTPGAWSATIKANGSGIFLPATYTFRVHRLFATNIVFDGGTIDVTNHMAGTWRYYRIDVPPNAFGWDVRLVNVFTNNEPRMVVRRDFVPPNLGTSPWSFPQKSVSWPTGSQWAASFDWTGRGFNAPGNVNEVGRILAMGMGRPLEAGTYYIGVINSGSSTNSMAYTVLSRGIGTNFTIPVTQIAFSGGSFTTNGLPAREAAYFSVNVPSNTPSWKIKLSTNASESMLMVLRDALPSVAANDDAAVSSTDSGARIQKEGTEHFLVLPQQGLTNIPAGNYHLAVAAEGVNATNANRIGAGSSAFTIQSLGSLPVIDLGVLTPVDIVQPGSLEGGEIAAYQFTVPPGTLSMEARLENRVGNPLMALRPGPADRLPVPESGRYGQEGGWNNGRLTADQLITVPNPSNGVWSLVVKASQAGNVYSNATYNVRISAVTATPVAFDGGTITVSTQPPGTWRYYRIDVPPETFGWDLRILNVPTNGNLPRLVVRRDQLPTALSFIGWTFPQNTTNWPSGYQWPAGFDWSQRQFSPNGQQDENGRILAMGKGRPLEAGTYYVGVINSGSSTNLLAYTLLSRGIGTNMSIGFAPLAFAGGTTNHPGLPAREAAYFYVDIASNTPSWKVRLAATSGDTVLFALKDVLPNILGNDNAASPNSANGGAKMKKDGNEHFVLWPYDPQTNLAAGRYYLAVASEGMNLTNANRIGVGASVFTLSSQGTVPVLNLGTIGNASVSHALEGGELHAYQFNVASSVQAFEAILDDRVGNPGMTLRLGTGLPFSPQSYGEEAGFSGGRLTSDTVLTVANPSNATYSLTVKAQSIPGPTYPDASYTLRVRAKQIVDLSFAPLLNTITQTNIVGQLLADDQRAFYRVVVPSFYNGHPVIGWRLLLSQTSGQATVRVRRDFVPGDTSTGAQSPFGQGDYVIVAPFLTPGTWYVEVRATGSTEYRLESNELLLERPAWNMQQVGQPTTTPGLTAPNFGDSGVDVAGNPLPGDQGIDLARNAFHYYAINVPPNNSGVMRVVLEAINGNPDFYMRTGAPPTLAHGPAGPTSPTLLYERYLNDISTEYANWVAEDGRNEHELAPGQYYIAIRAVTSNVRYRLRLSAGDIQNLALDGGSYNNQILAAGDWRYYRLFVPTNAPKNWNITFNQIVGNVIMHVRDTTPPGQGNTVTDYIDWLDDNKNHSSYPNYDPAGTHTIGCPPLRPGHTYYLGFRAVNDATFSVNSAVSGGTIDITNIVEFYGGVTNTTIPASGSLRFRVDVPLQARRWIHYATNAATVRIYIDQGSCPSLTSFDHYSCQSANCTYNHDLYSASWPWMSGFMYYVTVTNTSGSAQPFYFRMDGRDCYTFAEDQDNDQLPDCWELTYWPSIFTYTTLSDPDNDGVPNLYEYLNGSNPTTPDSFFLTDWATLVDRNYQFRFVGPTNGRYRIQAAPALTGIWTQIRFFTNSTGSAVVTDTNATNFPIRFYRARSQ